MLKLIRRAPEADEPVESSKVQSATSRIAEALPKVVPVLKRNKKLLIALGLAAVVVPLVVKKRR